MDDIMDGNPMEQVWMEFSQEKKEMVQKVAGVLGKSIVQVLNTSHETLIGEMVREVEKLKRIDIWEQWKDQALVSRRTFYRRMETAGMTPEKAAMTEPAPTRGKKDE